jgi:hypothetical protein
MAAPTGPYKPIIKTKPNPKKTGGILERNARHLVRAAALIILSYLAWKGVAGLLESAKVAKEVAAYVTVAGLLALFYLV